jgi:predicted  nucleic acid-binding Zn-ribbon protein
MEAFEQSESSLKDRAPEVEKLNGEMTERLKAFEEQIRVQTEQLATRRSERERLSLLCRKCERALQPHQRAYAMASPLPKRETARTACFMALRPQVMSEVRRGDEIVTCDNCNRILYYAPSPETATSKTPTCFCCIGGCCFVKAHGRRHSQKAYLFDPIIRVA